MIPLLFLACAVVRLPEPTETMVDLARQQQVHDATLESLGDGRKLVLRRCAGCHAPPAPDWTADPEWPDIWADMILKAKLDSDQTRAIATYLEAAAALPPEPEEEG